MAVAVAVGLTFVICAVPIRLAGADPLEAYRRYLFVPLTSAHGVQEVLLAATPLLFTGLAVAVAFRAGYFNIGAEGQFLAGAMGAAVPGLYLGGLPVGVALPLALLCGAGAGTLWALLPALLRRFAAIDEVVTTLLLNPVALLLLQGLLNGVWRNPESGFPDSANFGAGYTMPMLLGGDRVHAGLILAIVAIALTGAVMTFTPLGLRIKAAGQAPDAARFSGIAVDRIKLSSALASGAIAGLAGAVQVLGVQHQVTSSIANGYGYTGIVVAHARRAQRLRCAGGRPAARRHQRRRPERVVHPAAPHPDGPARHGVAAADRRVVRAAQPLPAGAPGVRPRPRGELLMSRSRWLAVLGGMLTIATPLVYGALGAILGERAGVLNLGIEGTMYAGAFVGFLVADKSGHVWVGLAAAVAAGAAAGALMALLAVTIGVNQHVAGIGITLALVAACDFTNRCSTAPAARPARRSSPAGSPASTCSGSIR